MDLANSITAMSPINKNHHLAKNLKLWWIALPNLARGYTWRDISENSNNGTVSNIDLSVTTNGWVTNKHIGGTDLAFRATSSSSSKIIADYIPSCLSTGSSAFTYSCWVRKTSTGSTTYMSCCENSVSPVVTFGSSGSNLLGYIDAATNRNIWVNTGLNDLNWYHYVFIYNGSLSTNDDKFQCIRNGKRVSLSSTTGTIPTSISSVPTSFSLFNGANTGSTPGIMIDDIKVYDRAFSEAEAWSLYRESSNSNRNLLKNTFSRRVVLTPVSGNRIRRVICGGIV